MSQPYFPVIGLEIHIELDTKSKMFCACSANHFHRPPNTQTCPVCLGLPGALPVPNLEAIKRTVFLALALECRLNNHTWFDRKNYFYPDLPKGYQISQFFKPIGVNGRLKISPQQTVRIREIHLEEDTAKSIHQKRDNKKVTLLDFNKAGVPLIEIVSEPDLHSGEEAQKYAQAVHQLVRFLKISPANMEKGQMRLEANISLKKREQDPLPSYRVEVKNINSFRFLKEAIEYEIKRQALLLSQGKKLTQETRGYDSKNKKTFPQRHKESAYEYRYFPEPDIPPLILDQLLDIEKLKEQLIRPEEFTQKLINQYQLSSYQAKIISQNNKMAQFFLKAASLGKKKNLNSKEIANILINKKIDWEKLTPQEFIKKIKARREQKLVSGKKLLLIIKKVLSAYPQAVADYQKGKTNALAFFIGQVQKETKGKANIPETKKLLEKLLSS